MKYIITFLKGLGVTILSVFAVWGFIELTVWFGSVFMRLFRIAIEPAPLLIVELPHFMAGLIVYIVLFIVGAMGVGIYKIGEKL